MTPQPGDFFVARTVHATLSATVMSALIQWGTDSDVNHAGVYVGNNQVVEARPGGAGYASLADYQGDNTQWSTGVIAVDPRTRSQIVANALKTVGAPYGWLDCIAIALAQHKLGRGVDPQVSLDQQPWWVRQLARPDRLVCSQLVDQVYADAGVRLFTDHRWPGFVSPADLETLIKVGAVL